MRIVYILLIMILTTSCVWQQPEVADINPEIKVDPVVANCNKIVFASSADYTGNLLAKATELGYSGTSGQEGADFICNKLATDAKLVGTFVAWISSSTKSAMSRLTATGSWCTVGGKLITTDLDGLVDGTIDNPIHFNEKGENIIGTINVWTGTNSEGKVDNDFHCTDWSSADSTKNGAFGIIVAKNASWTKVPENTLDCSKSFKLYCFEN